MGIVSRPSVISKEPVAKLVVRGDTYRGSTALPLFVIFGERERERSVSRSWDECGKEERKEGCAQSRRTRTKKGEKNEIAHLQGVPAKCDLPLLHPTFFMFSNTVVFKRKWPKVMYYF